MNRITYLFKNIKIVVARVLFCLIYFSLPIKVLSQSIIYPLEFFEDISLTPNALSDYSFPISTSNREAQAFFDQGLQLYYSFDKLDAARSFRQAQSADPNCAICYWGEAIAWGANLNRPMSMREAPRAYLAINKAKENIKYSNEKEASLIRALDVRYISNYTYSSRKNLDQAYANAMRDVVEKYPNDTDIATIYAHALFLLDEVINDLTFDNSRFLRLFELLQDSLSKNELHIGACHLFIHAVASTNQANLGEECAHFLSETPAGVSHMIHMSSHIWIAQGKWREAVESNLRAIEIDQISETGEGYSVLPIHNLEMLIFSAIMDGQKKLALETAQDLYALAQNPTYYLLTLIRFGHFDDISVEINMRENTVEKSIWYFSQGYAALKKGDMDNTKLFLSNLEKQLEEPRTQFRGNDSRFVIGALAALLKGEIELTKNSFNTAINYFTSSVSFYDQLDFGDPDILPFSPRHWLGEAYLLDGEFILAKETFKEDLAQHPANGWSLMGLLNAYKNLEMPLELEAVKLQFNQQWSRSDVVLESSKF